MNLKMNSIHLFILITLTVVTSGVRIGSFNLHQYGSKKAENSTLTDHVARILCDFDLGVIQEVTDVSQKAPHVLLAALNKVSTSGSFTMALSERVGRSATKEQYIFFNRESTSGIQLVSAYIHNDVTDRFERPPLV